MKLTAIVTASPPELRQPVLRPGESLVQFFIRHHPEEWRKEADRLTEFFSLSASLANALRNGKVDDVTAVQAEVHRFVNDYLPRQLRTLRGLDELRKTFATLPPVSQHEIEILCPRPAGSAGDRSSDASLEKFGAKAIPLNSAGSALDLALLLPHAEGGLLWTVPSGTRLASSETPRQLGRVVMYFSSNPACALYQDGAYSMILRTSALRDLAAKGKAISTSPEQVLQQLRDMGLKASRDQGKDDALCYFESEFGGKSDTPPATETAKPWWKNILGS